VNKADNRSNRGGMAGLFFMAFTLALVSFSCTGPIIGSLLVDTVSRGTYLGPAIGMFGFSLALAIPFTLFAVFPSWLKELPKSGNWLNTVKVSLGFLELALALKFLSNVDLAYHWNVFNRDVFLVIWIVIFGMLGIYLLGKIRLSHDSEMKFLSLPRLFFAMLALAFTIYMIPGLWGAPLKIISAWLPPPATQDFSLAANRSGTAIKETSGKKYTNLFHAPHGLDAFYDYEQGLEYARSVNKPALLDFTGWSCTNCRKMEENVWSDPQVLKRLREDYVLISLYVDDRTQLAENEKYITAEGKKIKTIGQKWSNFETSHFNINSQPFYVIVGKDGKVLVPPQAFNLDINNYVNFLDSGKRAFLKQYD
jgi:thiol:disulfide interchange protein